MAPEGQPLYRYAHDRHDHFVCQVCGKMVRAYGNFGGGAITHARMHERRGEAEEILPWGGKHDLPRRWIIYEERSDALMPAATEDRSKLPKWAQHLIARLERDEESWKLKALQTVPKSAVPTRVKLKVAWDDERPVPEDVTVVFTLKDMTRVEAQLTVERDGVRIYAHGHHDREVVIKPEMSNVVQVTTKARQT